MLYPGGLASVEPTRTIWPSGWTWTSPSNSAPPKSTVAVPAAPKLASALPFGSSRKTSKSARAAGSPCASTTIRPFCWIASASPASLAVAFPSVSLPSPLKLPSSAPAP